MAEFFGFEINRKKKGPERPSFVPDTESDGAGVITTGGHFGVYLDLDGDKAKTEIDLLLKSAISRLSLSFNFYSVSKNATFKSCAKIIQKWLREWALKLTYISLLQPCLELFASPHP